MEKMLAETTGDLSLEKRVSLAIDVIDDTVMKQAVAYSQASREGDSDSWLKAHELINYSNTIKQILVGTYNIVDSELVCDTSEKDEVKRSFQQIQDYCRKRKAQNASCIGCPIRKPYGTKQPEVCRLNQIDRPSDIDI